MIPSALSTSPNTWISRLTLLGILFLSGVLNLFGNDFPLGYHIDEPKKVHFIQNGTQDFLHPILMLQIARVANTGMGYVDDFDVAVLARTCNGLVGVLIVAAIYLLASRLMTSGSALVTAAATAVCPILVVHAHYIKEDIVFTASAIWALYVYTLFLERPGFLRSIPLGVLVGLAGSSHYKASLLIPLFLLFPLRPRSDSPAPSRWNIYFWGLVSIILAADVFALVNYPLFITPQNFLNGVSYEAHHAVEGHDGVLIWPGPQWFTYHLRKSIIPGMTLPAAIVGLIGWGWSVFRWNAIPTQDRLLALFAFLYYIVPECSPTKPPPDDCRYMIPVVVALTYFAGRFTFGVISRNTSSRNAWLVLGFLMVSILCVPLTDSLLLVWHMNRDTRERVVLYSKGLQGNVVFLRDSATWYIGSSRYFLVDELKRQRVDFVVVSSFHYDRYFFAGRLKGQEPRTYNQLDQFLRLFAFPFVEFPPAYRTFAFSNPTVRVVDIRDAANTREPP